MAGEALRAVKGEGRTRSARLRKPKELARAGEPEEPGSPSEARARPQPARGLPGATSAPSPPPLAGRGGARAQKTPTSERAPAHPQLLAPAGPADQEQAANARRPGASAGCPGGLGGGSSEGGGRELHRIPGLPERPKGRVSKNRQRPAGGGEEEKGTRNSSPALLPSGPRPPLTRAEVWRKPRGAEGDGAAALGGRASGRAGGRRRPRPPREEPGAHARQSPPLPPPRLLSAPRSAPLARPAALTEARAPQPRVLLSAATTRARAGRGGKDRPVPAA